MRNTRQRRDFILSYIAQHGAVKVEDISQQFDVSTVTVRNDLRLLERQGQLVRAYGGAFLNQNLVPEQSLDDKSVLHCDIKNRIGAAAAAMVNTGDSIILDSGTTALCITKYLENITPLTVMTNSLGVMNELACYQGINAMVTGGRFRHKSQSFCGTQAEKSLKELHFDKLFLGVDGFHLHKGITTHSENEARLNSIMTEVAEEVIVVTDSSKFEKLSLYKIINSQHINTVITDTGIPAEYQEGLMSMGVNVVLVSLDQQVEMAGITCGDD